MMKYKKTTTTQHAIAHIIWLFLFCSLLYAGNITRMGEEKKGIRKLGESAHHAIRLKSPPAPKQKQTITKDNLIDVTDAPVHTWTSNKGTTIKARLIKLSPISAVFEKSDNKKIKIKRNKLSDSDQKYLNKYDQTGKFPAIDITRKVITAVISSAAFLLFAIWFVKNDRYKNKDKTTKRNITIGTGL